MLYTDDIELIYQLRRKNNPDESELNARKFAYKVAMVAAINEVGDELYNCGSNYTSRALSVQHNIR